MSFSGSTLVGVALFLPLMAVTIQLSGCRRIGPPHVVHYTYTGLTLPAGEALFLCLALIPGFLSALFLARLVVFRRGSLVQADALLSFTGILSSSVGLMLGVMLSHGPFFIVGGETIAVQYKPAFYVTCVGSALEITGLLVAFYALCPALVTSEKRRASALSEQANVQASRASPLWGAIGSLSGFLALAWPFEITALLAFAATLSTSSTGWVASAAFVFFLIILPLVAIRCRVVVSQRASLASPQQGSLYLAYLGEAWSYAAWSLLLILFLSLSSFFPR